METAEYREHRELVVEEPYFGDMDTDLRCVRVALFKRMDRGQIENNQQRELQIRRFKMPFEILETYGIKEPASYTQQQMKYLEVFTEKHRPKDLFYSLNGKPAMILHHLWDWNCFNEPEYKLPSGGKKKVSEEIER